MIEYRYKRIKGVWKFTENGHTMFEMDVLRRLQRLSYLEEQVKQGLLLPKRDVIIMLLCLDDSTGSLTIDNEYELIKEYRVHYNIIDDNGDDKMITKSFFEKIN